MDKLLKSIYCSQDVTLDGCSQCHKLLPKVNNIYDFLVEEEDRNFFKISDLERFYSDNDFIITDFALTLAKELFELASFGYIIDLGCGDGYLTLPLAKLGAKVIAIDSSLAMLNRLTYSLKVNNIRSDNVILVHADASSIPLASEKISLVLANNIFHLLDNPNQAFKEIYRVLQPQGKFVQISDSLNSTYFEKGDNLETYHSIKERFVELYKKELENHELSFLSFATNFNPILEAKKIYAKHTVKFTKAVSYEFSNNLEKDFLAHVFLQSDYPYIKIPSILHHNIYQKVMDELAKEFNIEFKNISYTYYGIMQNILDIFEK